MELMLLTYCILHILCILSDYNFDMYLYVFICTLSTGCAFGGPSQILYFVAPDARGSDESQHFSESLF